MKKYKIVIDWVNTDIKNRIINFISTPDRKTQMEFLDELFKVMQQYYKDVEDFKLN